MTLKELLERRAAKAAEARALVEVAEADDRALTDDEKTSVDALMDEIGQLGDRAEQQRALDALAVANAVPGTETGQVRVTLDEGDRQFRSFGEQLQAIAHIATNPGATLDIRQRGLEKRNAEYRAASGLSIGIGADGGFAVQTDFASEILQRVYDDSPVLSSVTTLDLDGASDSIEIPTVDETSRVDGSRFGGVQAYWVGEATAPTVTNPKLGKIVLKLKKLAALGYATDEMLQHSKALGTLMTKAFVEEIRFKSEDSIIEGDGVAKCLGIKSSDCLVTQDKAAGQAATTIVYENVRAMWSRMYARSRANAVWYINQDAEPQLWAMSLAVGTGGSAVFLPAGGASDTPYATLFGRPIIPIEYCETLGTEGDLYLADMSRYYMIRRDPMEAASSLHVKFTTFEQAFRLSWRVDGAPSWLSALTPFKGTATQSPFVSLAVRA